MISEAKDKMKSHANPKQKKLSHIRKPDNMTLDEWQRELRRQFGQEQNFVMENTGDHPIFSDFAITNPKTGGTYHVMIRGDSIGLNYCSCPDFAVNTLGTCKHIEFALSRLGNTERNLNLLRTRYVPPFSEVQLRYGAQRLVQFSPGTQAPEDLKDLAAEYFDIDGILRDGGFARFDKFLKEASLFDHELRCYDDVLAFVAENRDTEHRHAAIAQRYQNGKSKEKMASLLKVSLYPYQYNGALFAAMAGRSLIADDMGLGKTIQAIAATEILAREFGVENVFIICPTSLKYQWKYEIEKFCDRSAIVIEGLAHQRRFLYANDAFFKIVNYELISRDLDEINAVAPDLVILDEAQRIKNWKTRTAQNTKRIESEYAIVLTGTPLENRLEELHSIVQFVDCHRLGPLFRFLAIHQISDPDTGRAIGYKNLNKIGETLNPILIRRTKNEVLHQLPERMEKNFFVPMTKEQWILHDENREIVARIVAKWKKYKFLSEADQRRLTVALQYMRMACDNTYLLDQKTCFGPKLDELITLINEIIEQPDSKVVIFSQWQRMNNLVTQGLNKNGIKFVYLHGGVPGIKRNELINAFRDDPSVRIFLSTDAGGTGLNLQSASTIINLDLPWNPAVLEQRIGRVHRIGQHKPVRVINFVSEGTIEHGMLEVLSFKKSIFEGVFEGGDDTVFMGETRLNKFMKGVEDITEKIPKTSHEPPPPTPVDSEKEEAIEESIKVPEQTESIIPLLQAGASFLKELGAFVTEASEQKRSPVSAFLDTDEKTGRSYLKIPMPDQKVLEEVVSAIGPLFNILSTGIKSQSQQRQ